jgi:hypothetical protein
MRIKKIRKVTAIKITALMAVTQTHSKLSLVKVHMKPRTYCKQVMRGRHKKKVLFVTPSIEKD